MNERHFHRTFCGDCTRESPQRQVFAAFRAANTCLITAWPSWWGVGRPLPTGDFGSGRREAAAGIQAGGSSLVGARTDTFDTFGFGNSLPSETAKTVGPGTYLGGLWPSCPGGIIGWLWAASNHPPSGPSHDPLLLAVIDPSSGTIQFTFLDPCFGVRTHPQQPFVAVAMGVAGPPPGGPERMGGWLTATG